MDPDARDSADTADIQALLAAFIEEHFPGVEGEVAVEESCIYTVSPDWNPVIDTVPGQPRVVVVAGFSGTGFKLGPVTGRLAAELAVSGGRQAEGRLGLARLARGGRL